MVPERHPLKFQSSPEPESKKFKVDSDLQSDPVSSIGLCPNLVKGEKVKVLLICTYSSHSFAVETLGPFAFGEEALLALVKDLGRRMYL